MSKATNINDGSRDGSRFVRKKECDRVREVLASARSASDCSRHGPLAKRFDISTCATDTHAGDNAAPARNCHVDAD
uniref:hypothetical protein n=1 Tax=Calothrix sp. FACHB-1219 TaxID=2692778 RepID=UPI001F548D54